MEMNADGREEVEQVNPLGQSLLDTIGSSGFTEAPHPPDCFPQVVCCSMVADLRYGRKGLPENFPDGMPGHGCLPEPACFCVAK